MKAFSKIVIIIRKNKVFFKNTFACNKRKKKKVHKDRIYNFQEEIIYQRWSFMSKKKLLYYFAGPPFSKGITIIIIIFVFIVSFSYLLLLFTTLYYCTLNSFKITLYFLVIRNGISIHITYYYLVVYYTFFTLCFSYYTYYTSLLTFCTVCQEFLLLYNKKVLLLSICTLQFCGDSKRKARLAQAKKGRLIL